MKEPNYAKLTEFKRNGLIEQVHFGLVVHLNKNGIINKIGDDNDYKFYHRSCMKPMQIAKLIDLGLDEKYNLTEQEIAVCAASHTGDKIHQKVIDSILSKSGFTQDDMLCPIHEPLSKKECAYLLLNNLSPQKIHNNCSGKHSAMLLICKEMGFDIKNYTDLNHPLTHFIINRVCELCEVSNNDIVISKDGCGLPVIATTLFEMGRGLLNLFIDDKYIKITKAFLNNPILIGGENRLDTKVIQSTKNIVAKVGACGLCCVVNLEKEEAFVVKIADSNMDAREIVVFETMKKLGWMK